MDNIFHLPSAIRRSILTHHAIVPLFNARSVSSTTSHVLSQPSPDPPTALLTPSPTTLHSYTTTLPPTSSQLTQSSAFFTRRSPVLLYTTPYFRLLPPSPIPEVAFLGRSNVGKSSLLNALLGRTKGVNAGKHLAHVSKQPGKTRTMNGYGVGGDGLVGAAPSSRKKGSKGSKTSGQRPDRPENDNPVDPTWTRFGRNGLVLVDMPGYGRGSREEWGAEIMKYLTQREQLRRTYVLISAKHGPTSQDKELLQHLAQNGVAHTIVLSKVDELLHPRSRAPAKLEVHKKLEDLAKRYESLRRQVKQIVEEAGGRGGSLGDVLCCSAVKSLEGSQRKIGIHELRWSILTACGLENTGLVSSAKQKGTRRVRKSEDDERDVQFGSDADTLMHIEAMRLTRKEQRW